MRRFGAVRATGTCSAGALAARSASCSSYFGVAAGIIHAYTRDALGLWSSSDIHPLISCFGGGAVRPCLPISYWSKRGWGWGQFENKYIIVCSFFLFQRSCLFTVNDLCFWATWKSCVVHQQRPTRPTCRTSTDLGHLCVHREFQLRSRNKKKNTGSAVHKQPRGTWRKAWVEDTFRILSLDGHFGRPWALVAGISLCNHGEWQQQSIAKPKQEKENQGDRVASATLHENDMTPWACVPGPLVP